MLMAATKPDHGCEAQFYVGEWHLLRGDRAAAAAALQLAEGSCPKEFYEYEGAVIEQMRLLTECPRFC
jgi:rhomboid protease GluP